ncbi:hypothetical protein [Lactococcus phage PMBT68]|nr:hypothetical protein [Lactococcus phage P1411]
MNVYVLSCQLEDISWVHSVVLDINDVLDSYLKVQPEPHDPITVYVEKFDSSTGYRQDLTKLERTIFTEFSLQNNSWKLLNHRQRINLGTVKAMYDDE